MAAADNPLDITELLRTLVQHDVDFVVIGGIAVQAHGSRRTTKDLDLIPAADQRNYERLAAALMELEARPRDIPGASVPTVEQLQTAPIVPPLMTRHGELHILREVPGAAPYDELRARALVLQIDDIPLPIAGRDDVIAMKRATGRPADLADLAVLTERDD